MVHVARQRGPCPSEPRRVERDVPDIPLPRPRGGAGVEHRHAGGAGVRVAGLRRREARGNRAAAGRVAPEPGGPVLRPRVRLPSPGPARAAPPLQRRWQDSGGAGGQTRHPRAVGHPPLPQRLPNGKLRGVRRVRVVRPGAHRCVLERFLGAVPGGLARRDPVCAGAIEVPRGTVGLRHPQRHRPGGLGRGRRRPRRRRGSQRVPRRHR
mmetsp:Transcript_25755/g.73247  ORF Transcript_25755/g.73247 Transcript_25755/m.73247 type:complete len:209 (+) Transcript_25755:566-1192(+)